MFIIYSTKYVECYQGDTSAEIGLRYLRNVNEAIDSAGNRADHVRWKNHVFGGLSEKKTMP